eukprot:TRINITY_DN34097_c0_g1_i1.p3 TRINITY_DN34097_c0_g1~~TRINITY_DN34097_c0_g1_i1.p3  ORF type:complete len:169 (-),score=16.03 TRINITY_DN34097_c0_g1_i1:4-510(-)
MFIALLSMMAWSTALASGPNFASCGSSTGAPYSALGNTREATRPAFATCASGSCATLFATRVASMILLSILGGWSAFVRTFTPRLAADSTFGSSSPLMVSARPFSLRPHQAHPVLLPQRLVALRRPPLFLRAVHTPAALLPVQLETSSCTEAPHGAHCPGDPHHLPCP